MSEEDDDAWLQPVTIEETKGPHWVSVRKPHPKGCSKDARSLSAQARQAEYVCCSECGRPVTKEKIGRHWEAAHAALLGKDPTRPKVLGKHPPPAPLADWGFLLLQKVGWAAFRTKHARERRLFEAQAKTVVLQGHAGFGYDVPKASRANKPPAPKKRRKGLCKRKGRKQGTPRAGE